MANGAKVSNYRTLKKKISHMPTVITAYGSILASVISK